MFIKHGIIINEKIKSVSMQMDNRRSDGEIYREEHVRDADGTCGLLD